MNKVLTDLHSSMIFLMTRSRNPMICLAIRSRNRLFFKLRDLLGFAYNISLSLKMKDCICKKRNSICSGQWTSMKILKIWSENVKKTSTQYYYIQSA